MNEDERDELIKKIQKGLDYLMWDLEWCRLEDPDWWTDDELKELESSLNEILDMDKIDDYREGLDDNELREYLALSRR